jgi:hypothetical protein
MHFSAARRMHIYLFTIPLSHNFRAACVVNRTTAAINCESPLFFRLSLSLSSSHFRADLLSRRRHLVRHFNQRIVKKETERSKIQLIAFKRLRLC